MQQQKRCVDAQGWKGLDDLNGPDGMYMCHSALSCLGRSVATAMLSCSTRSRSLFVPSVDHCLPPKKLHARHSSHYNAWLFGTISVSDMYPII